MNGIHMLFTDVPSSKSSSAPVYLTYEECQMKNVVEMQHNLSYAVPSQLNEKEGPGNKMTDKKGNTIVYEPPS